MTAHELIAKWVFEFEFLMSRELESSLWHLFLNEDPACGFEIYGKLYLCGNGVAIKTSNGWTIIRRDGKMKRDVTGSLTDENTFTKNSKKVIDL